MKKLVIAILLILTIIPLFAGNKYYDAGDTNFSIRIGSNFPFLTSFPKTNETFKGYGTDAGKTGLGLGISGSLSYVAFLNSDFAVGGELGYILNSTRVKEHYCTQVPMSLKGVYIPVQLTTFDVVLSASLGYDYIKFQNNDLIKVTQTCSSLFANISVQPTYYFGSSWGLGVEAGIMGLCELHTKTKKDYNAIMLSCPVSLVVNYRH